MKILSTKNILLILFIFTALNIFSNSDITGEYYSGMSIEELKNQLKTEESNTDEFLKNANLGLINYFLSNLGEKTALMSIDYLEKALSLSQNELLKAYLGSAYILLASEEDKPGLKFKYAKTGFKILDEVYGQNQDNFEISIIYIYANLEVPQRIFKRLDYAVKAIDKLLESIDNLEYKNQAELLYLKGVSLLKQENKKEAGDYFQKVIDKYSDTDFKKLSESKLKEIK